MSGWMKVSLAMDLLILVVGVWALRDAAPFWAWFQEQMPAEAWTGLQSLMGGALIFAYLLAKPRRSK